MINTGKEYEDFIEYYYSELARLSRNEISFYRNTSIRGKTGQHNIDVVYDFNFIGHKHRVLVECKDYSRDIDYPTMRSFVAACIDIPDASYVMYSPKDFGKNPKEYAEKNGITCVAMGEVEGLMQLIAKRIEAIVMADVKAIGEPFWGISEIDNNEPMAFDLGGGAGIIICHKKSDAEIMANRLSKKENQLFAYGIRQENLAFLIRLAKSKKLNFYRIDYIKWNPKNKIIRLSVNVEKPDLIEADFLHLGHI
ncbi:hypothetical protein GCM10008956_14510 [Deinococcus arenae]|uniref:Restriction endonuclease type IV Mrr domain-containing protein n=1 Tax=Deinococcus arenae TaxID=1452751 RepID=A0A8H9L7D5_9DEIO|nr:restriction endonuclease [Deinococcus arenae]AWT36440.1 hypothetical protein DM785_13385 [Deinococcus actinosclerus]GGM39130.1 hypothetical protein GCM10008956_14510 [Deinococcus arenae]